MRFTATLAAAAALALPGLAHAVPIASGSQLNIGGFTVGVGTGTTINLATGLDFTSAASPGTGTPGVAGTIASVNGSGTGSFAGLSCAGDCGTIQDLPSFTSFTPMNDFYSTTLGVSFSLETLTAPIRIEPSGDQLATLVISGTGTFSYGPFDPTPGIFTLTTQGGAVTTFSASTVAQAVPATPTPTPEPASIALLGAGLLGLGVAKKRKHGLS